MAEQDITMYLQQSHDRLFENNRSWAEAKAKSNPSFFKDLAAGQAPEYLWIGCADSRIPAEQICGLEPGEAFIHRNIANLVCNTDLNAMGVINYAVKHLGVKHIIVCGHYGCGGVKAAMTPKDLGLLNPWLRNIRDVYRLHEKELDAIEDESARYDRLVELNVVEQCRNVIKSADVQQSYSQNKYPIVHGWVFGFKDGLLKDLKIDFEDHGLATPDPAAVWAFKVRAGDASGGGQKEVSEAASRAPCYRAVALELGTRLCHCCSLMADKTSLCVLEGAAVVFSVGTSQLLSFLPLGEVVDEEMEAELADPGRSGDSEASPSTTAWPVTNAVSRRSSNASDAIANPPDMEDTSQRLVGLPHIRLERSASKPLPLLAIPSSLLPSAAKMSENQLNEAPTAGTLPPPTDADPTLASSVDEVRLARVEVKAILNNLNFIAEKLQHLIARTDKICDLVTEIRSRSSSISSSDASAKAEEDTSLPVPHLTVRMEPEELKSEELLQTSVGDHEPSMATAGKNKEGADKEQEAEFAESSKSVDGDTSPLA
ncbi:hypothetical protein FDECE_18086 [Fusarium decemcellulare]|nr:hypothetical protein FDECE_18086 [Fusarium decemcellulare]